MREIKEASYIDYIFLFGIYRNYQSDNYVNRALKGNGKIFILYEDKTAKGYICYERFLESNELLYAYTIESERNTGIFTELVRYIIDREVLPINCTVSVKIKSYEYVSSALKKLRFNCERCSEIYECDKNGYNMWEKYMEKTGRKYCEALKRQGFECYSFSEAPHELLNELYYSDENEFNNQLYPRQYFDNEYKEMNMDMSFMAEKEGHLAAYCLVRSLKSECVVFEQHSASEKYKGTGVIFLPFAEAMENLKKYCIKKACYSINTENESANAFRKKILDMITSDHYYSELYYFSGK